MVTEPTCGRRMSLLISFRPSVIGLEDVTLADVPFAHTFFHAFEKPIPKVNTADILLCLNSF